MGEQPTTPPSSALFPVPVPVDNSFRRPPLQRSSSWSLCVKWFQYHSIQIRWDIERWLARRFHRRWSR